MKLSRAILVFLALTPLSFGASKEIQELQRDVAMLQEQVRNMQRVLDEKFSAILALTQQTNEGVNRANTAVAVLQNGFGDAMKRQQENLAPTVAGVGTKLDQMSEDFRAVRESVLDMNSRMSKLDAKMADLQNLINTISRPAAPPPVVNPSEAPGAATQQAAPAGPPAGVSQDVLYTNAVRDLMGGKNDLAMAEFTDYLRYFKTETFAPNAQYYIGEIYYRKEDYTNASQAFDAVLEHFSENNKTADAHFMKGMCLLKTNRNDSAAREFREVYTKYPDSDVAAKARARLKEMGLSVGSPAPVKKNAKRR